MKQGDDMNLTVDEVINTYLKLRKKKEAIEAETKDKVKGIKDNMAKLEGWIKEQADTQGVKSFKTDHGTAFLTTTDFAQVADWDSVLEYIMNNDAFPSCGSCGERSDYCNKFGHSDCWSKP